MLRRKIEQELLNWKNNPSKLPLVIEGARQVGKTTSVEDFASRNYKTFYKLNFFETPEFNKIFEGNLSSDAILSRLSFAFPSMTVTEGSTLIFLDEIQHCPNARTALKFMASDSRFDVIASGSLLGINFAQIESLPVGYTQTMKMYPLDFEEFLWAMGIDETVINNLRLCYQERKPVDSFIHNKMLEYFSLYIVIGGMPAVVNSFASTHDYSQALRIQRDIVSDYKKDVVKYAESKEKTKIIRCMDSITSQLAKDYKKFQYSVVEKGSSFSKYGGALLWLRDAGIVSFCNNLSKIDFPLEAYSIDNEFKIYMNDTGLLVSMYGGNTAQKIMEGDIGIFKGAFYENIMAICLSECGHKLFYFSPSDTLEIDFVIIYKGKPCIVEVKSGENTKSKSLNTVLSTPKYNVSSAIRLSRKNIGEEGNILSLPLYMAMFLKEETNCSWTSSITSPEEVKNHLK